MPETSSHSFFRIASNAFISLNTTERKKLLTAAGSAVLIAVLEWLSLAVAIPVLFKITDKASPISNLFTLPDEVSVNTIFIILICVFVAKTIVVFFLVNYQLKITNGFYIDYSRKMYSAYFNQDF